MELGVGVSIYFKTMKNLIAILLICTMLSMPAYILFYSGRTLNNPDTQIEGQGFEFDSFLGSISLANIGEISTQENIFDLNSASQKAEMFCETGTIGAIQDHFIAQKQ